MLEGCFESLAASGLKAPGSTLEASCPGVSHAIDVRTDSPISTGTVQHFDVKACRPLLSTCWQSKSQGRLRQQHVSPRTSCSPAFRRPQKPSKGHTPKALARQEGGQPQSLVSGWPGASARHHGSGSLAACGKLGAWSESPDSQAVIVVDGLKDRGRTTRSSKQGLPVTCVFDEAFSGLGLLNSGTLGAFCWNRCQACT